MKTHRSWCFIILVGCGGSLASSPSSPARAPSPSSIGPAAAPKKAGVCGELAGELRLDASGRCLDAAGGAQVPPDVQQAQLRAGSLVTGRGDAADRFLALGEAALERDEYQLAKQYFAQALEFGPKHPAPEVGRLRAELGLLGIKLEYKSAPDDVRLDGLQREAEALALKHGAFGLAHRFAGRLWLVRGEPARAEVALSSALKTLALDPETHSALGIALLAQGRSEAALEHLREAAELDATDARRLTNLGTALMMEGHLAEAINAYRRGAALSPEDARAQGDLGTALLADGRPSEALPLLTKAQELSPERATFMSNLGYAHQQLGYVAEARNWYDRALIADPSLGSAWLNLATLDAAAGRYAEARRAVDVALQLDPEDPRALASSKELKALGY